ncbi:unnamed protein product [Ambrosiozyma monospora]|uniref:Unnamed protein product n=1 Tax=Ambrosiozyma monospora TaxID=43982 RepID=A0ACB5SWZ3_AMBMO|nr:unnamed protein product [Ambrosiozyma monospora]
MSLSSFAQFNTLPTELQLEVLKNADSKSLMGFLQSNKHYSNMVKYTVLSKLANHLKSQDCVDPETFDKLFIGIFSPQSAQKQVELYETKCANSVETTPKHPISLDSKAISSRSGSVENDVNTMSMDLDLEELQRKLMSVEEVYEEELNHKFACKNKNCMEQQQQQQQYQSRNLESTIFKLGQLERTRDPLRRQSEFIKAKSTDSEDQFANNNIHLIISEDSKNIKLQFDLYFEDSDSSLGRLCSMPTRISTTLDADKEEEVQQIVLMNGAVTIDCKICKGEEVPPRGPYDFDLFYNYYVEVLDMQVNNLFLLNCIEAKVNGAN